MTTDTPKNDDENAKVTDINTNKEPERVIPDCAILIALLPDGNLIIVKEVTKQVGLQVKRTMEDNEIPGFIIEAFMQSLMLQTQNMLIEKVKPFADLMMKLQAQGSEVSEQLAVLKQKLFPAETEATPEEINAIQNSLNEGVEIEMPKEEALAPTVINVYNNLQEASVDTIMLSPEQAEECKDIVTEVPEEEKPVIPEGDIPGDIEN